MFLVELEISNPCNEHCVHCYRVCSSTKKGFLSARQVKSVLNGVCRIGSYQKAEFGVLKIDDKILYVPSDIDKYIFRG